MSYASSVRIAIFENLVTDFHVKRTEPDSIRGYEPIFDKTILAYTGDGKRTPCVPSLKEAANWRVPLLRK